MSEELNQKAKTLEEIQVFQCPKDHWVLPHSEIDRRLKEKWVPVEDVEALVDEKDDFIAMLKQKLENREAEIKAKDKEIRKLQMLWSERFDEQMAEIRILNNAHKIDRERMFKVEGQIADIAKIVKEFPNVKIFMLEMLSGDEKVEMTKNEWISIQEWLKQLRSILKGQKQKKSGDAIYG